MSQPATIAPREHRKTCNVAQARLLFSSDAPPSRQHVYRLFNRGDIEGYFLGLGRGLRIYIDSIDALRNRQSGDAMIADVSENND